MRARWVQDMPPKDGAPIFTWTVVAHWIPNRYHLVCTLEVNTATSDDALSKLARQLNPNMKDRWVTYVRRCDKYGIQYSNEGPLYRREYLDEVAARQGHAEVVESLWLGKQMALHGFK